ncbi:protein kinase domain-containing protein [Pyxidicoccus xibeiensis]|uniref:protein kinase domain-containing protein n=1 Tax=Pyxidicoccus xibeiensis TaxID=2906759 RepID=UPI0020A7C0A5|nr:protein kinase [Pyxidicoccus xibeiensis]MCP3142481.1 protein kinase [Pyxidicoccus xibeiensis]
MPHDLRIPPSSGGESDFGDSLLREVARAPGTYPKPGRGAKLGGLDDQRFELLDELGEGGMGWVMRAWDAHLQRVVALKFIVPHEALVDLSLREARVVARLDHENIVRVFDVQAWCPSQGAPRIPFLVMEYLEGESLADLLRRERPDLRRTLDIMSTVAAGLAHAHEHHIVHRDLKPSNVFLTRRGTLKLIDFGLADLAVGGTPYLPQAGTPPYMAPEQWREEPLDERTDIWGAGVMLYELLTGELPYPVATLKALREKVLSPEPVPSLRERHPELPWALESLVAVALAKERSKRLLSAAELRDELRELEEQLRPGKVPRAAAAPQRRQVTLVSCRLEGLAGLARGLDPEDFGELEATFHRAFSQLIQAHGGFVAMCMGNEALACFGYPVAHEEDSERAVHAGLRLDAAVREALQERLKDVSQRASFVVKVGIHTDQVVLDGTVQELRGGAPSIQGDAPEVAAWLALEAGPGEVVLSHEAYTLVHRAFDTCARGPRGFDGSRQVRVYRVLGARRMESRFDRKLGMSEGLSPLVDRERELTALLTQWARAREGQGSLVLLQGEAGIGKSRLIQEFLERVPLEQAFRLRAQCWSQFVTSAFHPVIEALQRLWLSPERSPADSLRGLQTCVASWELTPMQAHLLGALLGLPVAELPVHQRLTPERQMEEVLEALGTLLVHGASVHPLLLVMEDLHWADPSTLKLLDALLARVQSARILVVLSARPEFHAPWTPGPGFHTVALERLSAESTLRLVREVAHGRTLPEALVRQLVARTDGVPLFVEEMTRVLLEGGAAASIPSTLQELLLARLDTLPRRQKELAQLCAVVGRDFTRELLAHVTGMAEDTLRRHLSALVAAGLLQRFEAGYQFRHALIQEAAYQSLPRAVRREHHRDIARCLVEHFECMVECRPELLAHHYTEAGDVKPAIGAWTRAGVRAALRYANQEAVSHLTQALGLLRGLPASTWRSQRELQLLLVLGLPLVQLQGYCSLEAERTYGRAFELMHELGDAQSPPEVSYWGAFAYLFSQKRFRDANEVGELLVRLGQRQGIDEQRALGQRMMATSSFNWGEMPVALTHIEQALEFSGDPADLARQRALAMKHWLNPRAMALAFSSVIRSALDDLDVARLQAREAVELVGSLGHPHSGAGALTYAAIGAQIRRDARSTLAWADQCIELSREHRFRLWLWWSMLLKGWALAWLGRAEEGLELMLRALPDYERSGFLTGTPHNFGMLAEIYLRLGRTEEGLEAVRKALDPGNFEQGERGWEADLHLIQGQLLAQLHQDGAARGEYLQALDIARRQGARLYIRRAQARLWRPRDEVGGVLDSLSAGQ